MDLLQFLWDYQTDPLIYLLILFLFSIAVAIVLPIPVEIGLIWNPLVPFWLKSLVLGAGKAVGSMAVFGIGLKLEPKIRSWSRFKWFKWFVTKSEAFVERYGYLALYVILSIPIMTDTVPLYIFSLLNKEGKAMSLRFFTLTNFLAGINRASLLGLLFYALGINLFS
ncbi:MAG: VTT domain-containing protein [Thermoplasmata archaeon]|nr:VTT domain-containing protein [Thermoplasmata archaeon]